MFEDEDEAREHGDEQGVIMAIRRIGQILVDLGFLREEQLEMLLEEQQQRPGEMFGQIAMSMGWSPTTSWPRGWPSRWACRSSASATW